MDRKPSETLIHQQCIDDTNVPAVTARLEMLTVNTSLSPSLQNKKTLRKRVTQFVSNELSNRRCSLRPKKRSFTKVESDGEIKDYYLDKTYKKRVNNLETIFEETANSNENCAYMSVRRYKRIIQFDKRPTDSKIKKRRAKIKKIFGKKHGSMQILLDKLNKIRSNSPVNTNTEEKKEEIMIC